MTSKLFLSILLVAGPSLWAAERPEPLAAIPVPDLPSLGWPGDQFLQADKEGRVFLLREDTLEVSQLSSGKLISRGRLVKDDSAKRPPFFQAAMSLSGDAWILYSPPNQLYLYEGNGRREHLEAEWLVSAVALDGDTPLLAVMPGELNTAAPTALRIAAPPLLQTWDGSRWSTVADGEPLNARPAGVGIGEHMRGESSVLLAMSPQRHLWVAQQHAYRLRHFSPSGVLKDELKVEGGQITWSARSEEEWARSEAAAKKGGLSGWSRRSLSQVKAEEVIRALVVGRDGAIYLLVRTKEGLALDRFQPSLATLDRVRLAGLELGAGGCTMAMGRDGLYIASRVSREGIWIIDSEALDKAKWRPVPGAMLNGQPLSPPPPGEKEISKKAVKKM